MDEMHEHARLLGTIVNNSDLVIGIGVPSPNTHHRETDLGL